MTMLLGNQNSSKSTYKPWYVFQVNTGHFCSIFGPVQYSNFELKKKFKLFGQNGFVTKNMILESDDYIGDSLRYVDHTFRLELIIT